MQQYVQTLEWRNSSNGICVTIEMSRFEPNQYKSTEMYSNQ